MSTAPASTPALTPTGLPVTAFERRFGHPPGLAILFFAEMWERFSYYGMRGLLKLYMANYLFVTLRETYQGCRQLPHPCTLVAGDPHTVLGWSLIQPLLSSNATEQASTLYGWYTGLVYLTPFFGGILADRYLGQRKAVVVGGLLMAAGHFVMAIENSFFIALFLLILGNGAFKPNVSTQVGSLYPAGDPRRDGAFTIFYMGINLGAFLCNFVVGTLAVVYGWHYGFAAAGVGMCLGLVVYLLGQKYLAKDNLGKTAGTAAKKAAPLVKSEWTAVWALVGLCLLNVVFWAVYEQQGNTMQTWADEKTVWPIILGWQIPSTFFQSFNPLCIFLFAPILDMWWRHQSKKGTEPSSVTKMAIGCFILGGSFIVMIVGAKLVGEGKGSLFWPLFCTFLLTIGELYLSPIGLSLVTKVSPVRIVSMMMGMWFISSFLGNTLSGYVGILYTRWSHDSFFMLLTAMGLAAGFSMWAFNKPLKKALGAHA